MKKRTKALERDIEARRVPERPARVCGGCKRTLGKKEVAVPLHTSGNQPKWMCSTCEGGE